MFLAYKKLKLYQGLYLVEIPTESESTLYLKNLLPQSTLYQKEILQVLTDVVLFP